MTSQDLRAHVGRAASLILEKVVICIFQNNGVLQSL
jgi:hypothetical protein